ncbi:MAG: nitroreductase family deazaflavin-dependent oxidoreductase [Alphaproteobacteria bacterium]|nr:nitroreductase family deazaflavin-dependent oxidoreductase [Alphaproteobacteria bacterium]
MAPPKPQGRGFGHLLAIMMTRLHVWLYRMSGGRIGGRMFNSPVLLLTTTGAKSGLLRTQPLLYLDTSGSTYVIVGSYGGSDTAPAWAVNLLKNPGAHIQVGSKILKVNSAVAPAPRKSELWPKLVAMYPDYQVYQQCTTRDIPVFVLTSA